MRARTWVLAAVMMLVFVGVALAGFCPRCHKQIPDDQKYCADCTAQMQAQQILSESEKALVDDVVQKRDAYRAALENLRKYYIQRGDASGSEKVDQEVKDFTSSRKYRYQNWEDVLPFTLSPAEDIREAQVLYGEAEQRANSVNPIGKEQRLREAAEMYRSIIEKYPTSLLIDKAAFRLGEIYEELGGPETQRAAHFFVYSFMWNPKTDSQARYRAARIYDTKLHRYDWAAWLYKLASTDSPDVETQQKALKRFEELKLLGHTGDAPKEVLTQTVPETSEQGAAK
jgi:TolA-binding protein